MDPTDLSDAQLDQLAQRLAPHLPTGTHGDRVVLSRRAFAAAVGGTLGASGLVALGVDPAAAQAAGQVGTSSSPVDAFTYDLVVQNALQSDLDAGGNKLTNVGSLSTDAISTALAGSSDLSDSRDFGSEYQNTTGNDLYVYAQSSVAAGESGSLTFAVSATSGVDTLSDRVKRQSADGDTAINFAHVGFRVPNGYYYLIDNEGDFSPDDALPWLERELSDPEA